MAHLCQLADLQAALGPAVALRLLDDDGDGVCDDAAVESVLDDTDNVIAGYLGAIYGELADGAGLPSAPPIVRTLAKGIAMEFCYHRRPEFVDGPTGKSPVRGRYDDAISQLEKAAKGQGFRVDAGGLPQTATDNISGQAQQLNPDNPNDGPTRTPFFKEGMGIF